MDSSTSSKTAAQMALSRALEWRKPAAERICHDPIAERFLDRRYRLLLLAKPLRDAVEHVIERLFAGHHYYVLARTRYIDDFLLEQVAAGAKQLVILGAGYDSRPYRFSDALREVAVFEVDHPMTSRQKRLKVERALGTRPTQVRYVPVDFNHDKLSEKLEQSGYGKALRTIFLWEGTTAYLSAVAVDDTLRFISSSSGHGSALVFDYILASVLDGTCDLRGARREYEKMKSTSEPFVFGIGEKGIESFLTSRGFRDVRDAGGEQLKERFPIANGRDRYVKPWWRIAQAFVP